MGSANVLDLIPARDTSQAAQSSGQSDRSRRSDDSGDASQSTHFKHKLAKKLDALKQTTAQPSKPAAAKAEQPNTGSPSATDQQGGGQNQKGKSKPALNSGKASKARPDESEQTQTESDHGEKVTTTTLDQAEQADQPEVKKQHADKKPAAITKPVTPDLTTAGQLANAAKTPQAGSANAAKSGDADSDPDAVDGITPSAKKFYGSGKVVAEAGPAGSEATDASVAGETPADGQAAAAVDPMEIADPTAEIEQPISKAAVRLDQTNGATSTTPVIGVGEKSATTIAALKSAAAVDRSPQARFVEANTPKIVSSIQGQLMPHGGTMQIRLDPPELGALQVTVHMKDGVMSASFETTSEHATKLLSHTLSQLKSGLEAAGMNVQKLQVQQSSKKDMQSNSEGDSGSPAQEQQQQAHQERQRKEMVQRMWQKLAGGDPLDLVA